MSEVPGLAYNPGITAEDIPKPLILFAQGQTKAAVEYGSLYTALGNEVTQIAAPAEGIGVPGESVRMYVLRGPEKKVGVITHAGETWVRDTVEELQSIQDVRSGPFPVYDYVVAIPDVDERLPYKIRFKRTGMDAAKEINMALLFAGPGNESTVAFELALEKRQGDHKYVVPVVRKVSVPALEAAKDSEKLEGLKRLAGAAPERPQLAPATASNTAPALD